MKNKVIAIFSGYTLPHLGGVEKYTENLSNELIKLGYKIIIVGTDYDFSGIYVNKYNHNKIIYRIPVHKTFVSRYPVPKKGKLLKKIEKELSQYNIESIIVNTRFYLTSLIGAKFGKKNKIPVFLVEHGSQHLTVDNKILDFFGQIYEHLLTMYIKRFVKYYYGVSEGACNWQKHFKINSNGIWYNSINDFSDNIKLNKNKNNKINICYAGRVIKQKGLKRLLDVFSELEKKYSNINLIIAGDGNYLDFLKENYKSKNIQFLGKIDFEKLKQIYSYTDIFVYAPIWPEGLPTSILEAGLLKCAVIGSPQGGIKEVIINNQTGLMIKNEDELYNSIEILINNDKLRNNLSNNLYKKIKNEFLWSVTTKKILNDIEKGKKEYEKSINI